MKFEELDQSDKIKVLKFQLMLEQRAQTKLKKNFESFILCLIQQLKQRYEVCEDFSATPSSILLSVLNAVNSAKNAVIESDL